MMIVLKNHEKLQVLKNMMAASAIVYDVEQHQSLNECPMQERHLVEFRFWTCWIVKLSSEVYIHDIEMLNETTSFE